MWGKKKQEKKYGVLRGIGHDCTLLNQDLGLIADQESQTMIGHVTGCRS